MAGLFFGSSQTFEVQAVSVSTIKIGRGAAHVSNQKHQISEFP
jgi:hypothetical protein